MTLSFSIKPVVAAVALAALFVGMFAPVDSVFDTGFVSAAQAAQGGEQGHKGKGPGQGGSGKQGAGEGHRGGKTTLSILDALEEDDDSDRPPWAAGNREENPHSGGGQAGSGGKTDKGDLYGDLYLYLRDTTTGEIMVFDGDEWEQCNFETCYVIAVCTNADCTSLGYAWISAEPDADLPAGIVPAETDLGRLNIGRAPDKVLDHAEDEAISKITADNVVLGLDPAGRITVDGATIDSPLENLALYIAIMTGDQKVLEALQPLFEDAGITDLQLAAVLLASAADKTGDILRPSTYACCDLVWYVNEIYGITQNNVGYDFSEFYYDRSIYDVEIPYYYFDTDGVTVLNATVNIKDYLAAANLTLLPTFDGILLFSLAADDALEVVELIHTQIHDGVLPGTVE